MLIAIWNLIMRDRLVLYPAIIGGFVNAWLMQYLLAHSKEPAWVILCAAGVWCFGLFVQLLVAQIGIETAHGKIANFGNVLGLSIKRFFPALFVITLMLALMLGVYLIGTLHLVVRLVVLVPLLFLAVIVQIYPVIYCISGRSAVTTLLVINSFIRERFQLFAQLMLFMIFLSLSFLFFSMLFTEFPAALKSLLLPFMQGWYIVMLNYAVIIAWLVQAKVKGVA